jgi:hypothetical protein
VFSNVGITGCVASGLVMQLCRLIKLTSAFAMIVHSLEIPEELVK